MDRAEPLPACVCALLSSSAGAETHQSLAAQPQATMVPFRACLKHRLPREMSCRASQETKERKFDELCFFPLGWRCLLKSFGCKCEFTVI